VPGVTFIQRIKTPFTEGPADEQPPYRPGMRLIGELLQERREELGLDLHEIGAMLRIKPTYLVALEQGRSHDLPGPTYAIGFVRAYADFLGLASDQVLARFKAEAAGITARPDLALPVPLGERSLPGGALVLVALILALCGYGFWYYRSTGERDRPERVTSVPAALQAPPTAPVLAPPLGLPDAGAANGGANPGPASPSAVGAAVAASQPASVTPPSSSPTTAAPPLVKSIMSAATAPAPSAPPATKPLAQGALIDSLPSAPPAASAQGTSPPQTAAAPQVPTAAPGPGAKIAIRALADCWIQVRGPDQSIVFSRVLKSGEVYTVPARTGLSLRTGNAGALEIAVDGKTAPAIGGIGMLRRDVALDPAELAAGTAVHG
jgi:cytoskeleton protein RodZ